LTGSLLASGCAAETNRVNEPTVSEPPPPTVKNQLDTKSTQDEENNPLLRANKLYLQGNLDGALAEVEGALKADPNDGRARYFYANFLLDKGELRGAATQFEQTLGLNPKDVPIVICWTKLGQIRERLGEHPAALDAYLKAIEMERALEAQAAAKNKSTGGAAESAFAGVPHGSPDPYRNLARIYLYLGDLDKALEAIEQARARGPRDPFTESLAVRAYQRIGDQDRAIESARRFIEIAGEDPTFTDRVRELRELVRTSATPLSIAERKLLVDYVRSLTRPRLPGTPPDDEYFARNPNDRLLRADDRAVFVTIITQDGSPRLRGKGRGKSLASATAGAVEAITNNPKFNPVNARNSAVRIDVQSGDLEPVELSPAEYAPLDEPVILSLQAKPPIEPGLHGVAIRVDDRELFCLPGDAVIEDLPDVKAMLQFASREAGLGERAWESASSRVFRFRTESFVSPAPGASPVELVRAEPFPFPEATPETLLESATLGAAWLAQDLVIEERPAQAAGNGPAAARWLKETLPNGEVAAVQTLTFARFHYEYTARTGAFDDRSYNEVRHAGAALALADAYARTGRTELRDSAELAARWLEDHAQQEDKGRIVIVYERSAKLGTQALTLALEDALAQATPQEDPVRTTLREGLAQTLLHAMRDDGTFVSNVPAKGTIQPRDADSQFFPGEALLALVRHYKATGEQRWLAAAFKGIDARMHEWRQKAQEGTPLLDAWLCRAICELDDLDGVDRDAGRAERWQFVIDVAKTVLTFQAGPDRGDAAGGLTPPGESFPRGMPTASLGEGLAAVAALAQHRGLEGARDFRDAVRRAATFALRHQYVGRNSFYLAEPERARGAFRSMLSSSRVRIDGVQHNVEFLLLAEKLLRD
jgi:tetratricopeptide (TPR) repeat protein